MNKESTEFCEINKQNLYFYIFIMYYNYVHAIIVYE